jgi:DNA-binding transcriptional LysR family regulator
MRYAPCRMPLTIAEREKSAMELHQVRYFLAVCDTLNFTRAAERCNVSQPSLTRAIKNLEDELGGSLFRRERRLTHMTDLGRLMRPHLKQVYDSTLAAKEEAEKFGTLEKAPLRLGVMCTISPVRLVRLISSLEARIPNLDLHLREAKGSVLVDEMMAGEMDVAILGLPALPDRLDTVPLYSERYVVAFPSGHRFEEMNAVPMSAMSGENYLQRINCEFSANFDATGIERPFSGLNVRYRSEREEWIQAMILAGMGCAFMPESMPLFPGLKTRMLIEPEVKRDIKIATVAGRQFTPATRTFIEIAQQYDWQRGI